MVSIDLDRPVVYYIQRGSLAKTKLTPTKEIVLLSRFNVIYLTSTILVSDLTHLSKHEEWNEHRGENKRLKEAKTRTLYNNENEL